MNKKYEPRHDIEPAKLEYREGVDLLKTLVYSLLVFIILALLITIFKFV